MKCHCNRRRRTPRYLHNENSNHLQMSPQHIGVWYHTLKIFKHKMIMFIIERHFSWNPMQDLLPKNNNEKRKNLVSSNESSGQWMWTKAGNYFTLSPLSKLSKPLLRQIVKNRERINLQHHKKFQLRFLNLLNICNWSFFYVWKSSQCTKFLI